MSYNCKKSKDQLDEILLQKSEIFLKTCKDILGREIHVNISRQDQLRLLNLFAWSYKYSISLKELLEVIFKVWNGKFSRGKGLGIAISTLTGKKSKEILLDYIKRNYQNQEHIKLFKQTILDSILPETPIIEMDDPVDFILTYRARIEKLRSADRKLADKFTRRKWRGNPFI